MPEYTYVDSDDLLWETCSAWSSEPSLGVDLECENNLHYYGSYICTVQVSTRKHSWVVDALTIKDFSPLCAILEDPHIEKIFHDLNFDLRVIRRQFSCNTKNLFDTQTAAVFLGKKNLGLNHLLSDFLEVADDGGNFQMADWTKRPIPDDMMRYAVGDTVHLLRLRDRLIHEMREAERFAWFTEEMRHLEKKDWTFEEKSFLDLTGCAALTPRQRSVLKTLHRLREKLAKQANRPTFYIINPRRLMELSANPPSSVEGWATMRGVHPIVRRRAKMIFEDVERAKTGSINMPPKQRVCYTAAQSEAIRRLSEARDQFAEKLNLPKNVVLSRDQMQEAAVKGDLSPLRNWQKEMFSGVRLR